MNFTQYNCVTHVIKQGDTLYNLSREYNVPLPLLFKANPYVDVYNLQIGDELCIPILKKSITDNLTRYVVAEGESMEDILKRFGIKLSDLLQYNDVNNMTFGPGTVLYLPNSSQ